MTSVSAIVLTKDSERTIVACVKALKPAVDHVIVVDTGSSDNTVQIAKGSGAKVYHFEWCDDFAAARNFGDSLATTDWVIHVDSDEILHKQDVRKIHTVCSKNTLVVRTVAISVNVVSTRLGTTVTSGAFRLYKHGMLRWHGIIHEQLIGMDRSNYSPIKSDIRFTHDGYDPTVVDYNAKVQRNLRLLKQGVEQEPNNASYHYYLGRESAFVNDFATAIPHIGKAIDLFESQGIPHVLRDAYKLLIDCLKIVGNYNAADIIHRRMVSKFNNQ